MQDFAAAHYTAEDMARKQAKPQGPIGVRLPPEILERLERLKGGVSLSRNEVLVILIRLGIDLAEEDPALLIKTHLKMEEERATRKP